MRKKKKKQQPPTKKKIEKFDPLYVTKLSSNYPDEVLDFDPANSITLINKSHHLQLTKTLFHLGCIYRVCISPCGSMLATSSSFGSVKIFDLVTLETIVELRDRKVIPKSENEIC